VRGKKEMSTMCYLFSADDLRLKTAIGIREANVIRIPMTNGTALYGPYVDLPAGHYEAVIRFDPDTPCHGGAMMDLSAGPATGRLTWQWITADQILAGDMSAKLEFSSSRPLQGVEVRLLVFGNFSAGIGSVEINGDLAKFQSESQSLMISDLPEPSVENIVHKGRNLYEGYQRGIGLAFSDLGTRITSGPRFSLRSHAGREPHDCR
jgi:hypothetical protein